MSNLSQLYKKAFTNSFAKMCYKRRLTKSICKEICKMCKRIKIYKRTKHFANALRNFALDSKDNER